MQKDFEETRAFYLVVEKEEKLWLRKVVMSVDKLVGEEELKAEDLYSFEKPEEVIEQALVVGEKLYLKSEKQIVIAKEGVVELPKGLKLKSKLVYVYLPRRLEVPGRAGGRDARRQHPCRDKQLLTPPPQESASGQRAVVFSKSILLLLILVQTKEASSTRNPPTDSARASTTAPSATGTSSKTASSPSSTGTPTILQSTTQSRHLSLASEVLSYTYTSQHSNEGSLLMVTPFSRYSKYLEIKRSLKA